MSSRVFTLSALALILLGPAALPTHAVPPSYTAVRVYDSTMAGFPRSLEYRYDVNRHSQILGRTLANSSFAVWNQGQMQDLTMPPGYSSIVPYRLNDSGRALFAGFDPGGQPALWVARPGEAGVIFMQDPPPVWHFSLPYQPGIDLSGNVLGTTRDSVQLSNGGWVWTDRAATWSLSGTGTLLGLPDDLRDSADIGSFRNSWGACKSDSGAIVIKARGLYGSPATTIERHFIYQGGSWAPIVPLPGWEQVQAIAVTDSGLVVGDMRDPLVSGADPHAFLWEQGQITDLHMYPYTLSLARGVNHKGHVVGTYYDEVFQGGPFPVTVPRTGFVYRDGQQYLLNDVVAGGFGPPSIAVAVNDAGVILAATGNSLEFTFLLVPSDTGDIPTDVIDDTDYDRTEGSCALSQNYPNPFNPSTTIAFTLPRQAHVTVEVLNIVGRVVTRLADSKPMSAGLHEVIWDGCDMEGHPVASGPYLYRVQADHDVQVRKMMLLK